MKGKRMSIVTKTEKYDAKTGEILCSTTRTGDKIAHELEKLANCPLMELSPNQPNLINYNELNTVMEAVNEIRPTTPDFPMNMSNKPIIPAGDARREQ